MGCCDGQGNDSSNANNGNDRSWKGQRKSDLGRATSRGTSMREPSDVMASAVTWALITTRKHRRLPPPPSFLLLFYSSGLRHRGFRELPVAATVTPASPNPFVPESRRADLCHDPQSTCKFPKRPRPPPVHGGCFPDMLGISVRAEGKLHTAHADTR